MDELKQQIISQQPEIGCGDYTKEREKWLGNPDLKELFDAVKHSKQNN